MDLINSLKRLRDDIKIWATNNFNALNAKIDEKTIPIDSELDSDSTNPVQNQAITKEIGSINDRIGDVPVVTQITQAINAQEYFSGDYNDLTNAPDIFENESGDMVITDESGNIIFKADANGIHTTAASLNGEAAATEKYVDEAISTIEFPEPDLTDYATEDFVSKTVETVKEDIGEEIISKESDWKIVDGAGNIIFDVDVNGAHTTNITLNGESLENIVDERIASIVDSAPDTLNTLNELANALGSDPNFASSMATEIGKKVNKIDGKGLSTNDFTDEYKNKVNSALQSYTETDPTVPAWAKTENKPTYSADEVGALPDTTKLADLSSDVNHRTVSDVEKIIWNSKSDFSGDYNDLENAPDISENNEGNLIVADKDGNIIFRADASGVETTKITAGELFVDGISVYDKISEFISQNNLDEHKNNTDVHVTADEKKALENIEWGVF